MSGSRLLYVLRADAVSPRQQEEPLLPAVAGPRRPLRHPHQLLGRRHARATQVPEGVPEGVPLSTQTQGQEIRSLVLIGRPKPPTYYKSIAIDFILKLPKVHNIKLNPSDNCLLTNSTPINYRMVLISPQFYDNLPTKT